MESSMATILVAEDNRVNLRMLTFTLEREGHQVIPAGDGLEALEQLADNTVDLLLADIEMPRMNGMTLVKRLRADERYSRLPIVVLTASMEQADHQAVIEAGADSVLIKPASSYELTDMVERILG
jgi:CheY-like chemotaxis protein